MRFGTLFSSVPGLLFTALMIAMMAGCPPEAQPQTQSQVVFQGAYSRPFAVTDCTNANPPVVTIQAPASNEALSYVPLDAGSLVTINGVEGNTACNVTDNAINLLTATTFELTGVVGNGDYTGGGTGSTDTISSANTPSPPMPNTGQSGHLISVEFPTAGATVTPIQVRLESAITCPDPPFCANGNWRPISEDVTEVTQVGSVFYKFAGAGGVWRAIRINSIAATPSSLPMRVDYTGSPTPIGAILALDGAFQVTNPYISRETYEFVAGSCQGTTAGLAFNGPAPLPEAVCVLGSDQTLAVAAFDDTTTECVEDSIWLNKSGDPSSAEVGLEWIAAATGTVEWTFQKACVSPGDTLGDINFAAANTVTADNTTAGVGDIVSTDFDTVDLNCLANDQLFWKFCRTGGTGTLTGDAQLKSIRIKPSN